MHIHLVHPNEIRQVFLPATPFYTPVLRIIIKKNSPFNIRTVTRNSYMLGSCSLCLHHSWYSGIVGLCTTKSTQTQGVDYEAPKFAPESDLS